MEKAKKCKFYSDPDYYEYLVEYRGGFLEEISKVDYACGDIINRRFAIVSVKEGMKEKLLQDVPSILFIDFRSMYVLEETIIKTPVESTNSILELKLNPYLLLSGKGVVVGIIDTGIDYLNKEFIKEDGTTRIEEIWDQTIDNGSNNENIFIGEVYNSEKINEAIESGRRGENPYDIVPSKDINGHGTKIAGIVGARGYKREVTGVANDCTFLIIKLRESPSFKKELKENNIDIPVYNAAEIVASVEYLYKYSRKYKKPVVILIGVGTSDYSHDGNELISRYLNAKATDRGLVTVCGTGNEGIADGHTTEIVNNTGDIKSSELIITRELKNFNFKVWVSRENIMSINIISPSGQKSNFISTKRNKAEGIYFIVEDCTAEVEYYLPYNTTGLQTIEIRFKNIKKGIWKFEFRGEYITDGRYDIWLPPSKTLPEGVKFLKPNPNTTLTSLSVTKKVISVGYYNQNNNTVIGESGRGYPLNDYIKPDIAAPGVNILTTGIKGTTEVMSGASVAAAITAGVCALYLQFGIVDKKDVTMFSNKIIYYLTTGAKRYENYTYPNRENGYGYLNAVGLIYVFGGNRIYREYYIDNIFVRLPVDLEVIDNG